MAKFLGPRCIPTAEGKWDKTKEYLGLSVVLDEKTGDSYTSKKAVPAGTELTNKDYWVMSGQYNVQMALIKQQLNAMQNIPEGGTTADAALENIRIGADGTEYATPGDAVRGQVGALSEEIYNLVSNEIEWLPYFYKLETGNLGDGGTIYKCTKFMNKFFYSLVSDYDFLFSAVGTLYGSSFISFKNNGVYVGYCKAINNKDIQYYNPDGTTIGNIIFDEFALNIYIPSYENYTDIYINSIERNSNCIKYLKNELENTDTKHKLDGKKLVVIGDSIANGAGYYGGYGKIIADSYNMTFVKNARNGATVGKHNGTSVILEWFNNTVKNQQDLDYLLIEGGFNDSWIEDSEFGTICETYNIPTADGTFCGNLNYMLYMLVHAFNTKKYGYIIVHKAGANYTEESEYYKATVNLCKKWGVPICDLNGIIPPLGLLANDDTLRTTYTGIDGVPDGVHPNESGYKQYYVPKIIEFMNLL